MWGAGRKSQSGVSPTKLHWGTHRPRRSQTRHSGRPRPCKAWGLASQPFLQIQKDLDHSVEWSSAVVDLPAAAIL